MCLINEKSNASLHEAHKSDNNLEIIPGSVWAPATSRCCVWGLGYLFVNYPAVVAVVVGGYITTLKTYNLKKCILK